MLLLNRVLLLSGLFVLQSACSNGRLTGILPDSKEHKKSAGVCDASTVQSVTLPRDYTYESFGTFKYSFEYVAAEPGKPTVIYIPGGPGQASIGDLKDWQERMPAGYGLVLTDPRGVGCNYLDTDGLKVSFFQSEYVARDVLSAAKELKLDNYMIYGISYGTLVATMAGSIAERETSWPKPKSIVLEGVLGRAFVDADEADSMYDALWTRDLAKLATDAGAAKADLFKGSSLPLGHTADEWLGVLRGTMMYGALIDKSGSKYNLTYKIMQSAVSDVKTESDWAENVFSILNADDESFTEGSNVFYAYIACQEVFPDLRSMKLENGVMTRTGGNLCTENDISTPAARFAASSWPITAPIYYFEGEDDPATPATLAKSEHFEKQTTSADRQFVLVKEAGHNPFGLNMEDCKDSVWAAMATTGDFKAAVNTCQWSTLAGFEISTAATAAVATTPTSTDTTADTTTTNTTGTDTTTTDATSTDTTSTDPVSTDPESDTTVQRLRSYFPRP